MQKNPLIHKQIILIILLTITISLIPFITSLNNNKAQAYFYVALKYTILIETGKINENQKNINKIISFLNKAINIEQNHPQSHYLQAHIINTYYKTKAKQALYHIQKAMTAFPKSPLVHIKTALIYQTLALNQHNNIKYKTLNKTLKHTKLAIKYSNNKEEKIEYKTRLAQTYIELKLYNKAIENFESTLKEYPNNPSINNNYAWFLATNNNIKNPKKALIYAKKAISLSKKNSPYILDTLATVYFELGEYKKAVEIEKEAYKLETSSKEKKLFKKKIKRFEKKLKQNELKQN